MIAFDEGAKGDIRVNVTGGSEAVYYPCIWLNPTTKKAEYGTYNYRALMEKFQQQVEQAKWNPPELGDQTLSEADIQALAKKYDPQNMSQAEYDEFIQYLEGKGVLSRLETSDLGMSRITIVPGYSEPAYIWTSSSSMGSSVRSLSDIDGNALQFAQIMSKWEVPDSSVQIRQGAYSKVLGILNQMNAVRGSTACGQTSSVCENDLRRFLSGVSYDKGGSGITASPLMMDLNSIQLTIDRIKSEQIQTM